MYICFEASVVLSSETLWTLTLQHSNISFIRLSSNERHAVRCRTAPPHHSHLPSRRGRKQKSSSSNRPAQRGPCSRSLHLTLPPFISLRLLAISAASPLPLHSSLSFHCQLAPPWAFFGTLGFVSSIRLGWPNFILYRIPLVWIHAHIHTQIGNLRRQHTCPPAIRVSVGWWPACNPAALQHVTSRFKDQIHHQLAWQ